MAEEGVVTKERAVFLRDYHFNQAKGYASLVITLETGVVLFAESTPERIAHDNALVACKSLESVHRSAVDKMNLAVECIAAGFAPATLSFYEIDQAKERWDESKQASA